MNHLFVIYKSESILKQSKFNYKEFIEIMN